MSPDTPRMSPDTPRMSPDTPRMFSPIAPAVEPHRRESRVNSVYHTIVFILISFFEYMFLKTAITARVPT